VDELTDLFEAGDRGSLRMMALLNDPSVAQITCDRFDRIGYIDENGPRRLDGVFAGPAQYIAWVNALMALTDAGFQDIENVNASTVEGSFRPEVTNAHGAVHICTKEITHGEPAVTVRKQPHHLVTLDRMLQQRMLSNEMRQFLELAVRGRSNILVSGGSGAGKTTLTRALSYFVDPAQRVVTCEEIQELRLSDRLPNAVELFTVRKRDADGVMQRETSLDDLVRESLRMRADRVWVGETRGREAYALIKACNSGHDGSITTMHADSGKQAVKQMCTYVMESGLPEQPAREQVSQAFNLVVQLAKVSMGRRVITEISELEPVLEGANQRITPIFTYSPETESFRQVARPTNHLLRLWSRNGVNYDGVPGRV
jgi:Flp pilus assembly CpaF family ATPase